MQTRFVYLEPPPLLFYKFFSKCIFLFFKMFYCIHFFTKLTLTYKNNPSSFICANVERWSNLPKFIFPPRSLGLRAEIVCSSFQKSVTFCTHIFLLKDWMISDSLVLVHRPELFFLLFKKNLQRHLAAVTFPLEFLEKK